VVFSNSGVETRPGLQALFGPFAGNPTINYIKTYETLNATLRTMALDANGILYKETTPGTLTSIATGLAQNSYGASTTIFAREYLAISDGRTGNDLPRQYDDTNFDRVSQGGPGGAPTVVDENVIVAVAASPTGATQPAAVAIAASPTGATENGFLVTISTSAAHGLSAGQSVTIAGVSVAGYNGTFPVVATPSTTQFTYIAGASGLAASGEGTASSATATITTTSAHGFVVGQLVTTTGIAVAAYNGTFPITIVPSSTQFTFTATAGGLAASGGGTAAAAGSVSAGVHQVCVMFQTRQGYLTKLGPAASWTASGSKRAVVTNIPTGPSNVIARILCFTGAGGASFFYTGSGGTLFSGNMILSDNTTTSLVVDFSDAILLAGTNVDNMFRLVELGDCAGVIDYNERLFWWGERHANHRSNRPAERPRPVSLRNAHENCRRRQRRQPKRRRGLQHALARAAAPIASVMVQAANSWFDISITDPAQTRPGLFYFAESDTTAAFGAPRVYFLGASRNLYTQLGNQTLYWRAYSQYVGSLPSAPVPSALLPWP
jgi:hypothetical protein